MLRRSGATHEVDILYGDEGIPLGIEKNSLLADRKIQLAPGDTLLLVTDGVVEALETDRNIFKLDKLALSLGKANSGPSQIVESIFKEISRISPGPPEDDLTAMAITWTPPPRGEQA